jgi:hypothetical protein
VASFSRARDAFVTEEQFAEFGLTFGVTGFMLYMLFIIFQLARESKAGKFGTFVLFLVLAFGMLGFVAKQVIIWVMEG